jgi:hypothetical protein
LAPYLQGKEQVMKATIKGHMVKFGTNGLGIADIADRGFVYFKARQLPNYRGETTRELVSQGYKPGRPPGPHRRRRFVGTDQPGHVGQIDRRCLGRF